MFALACLAADNLPPAADQRLAREIYQEMIETKSGFTTGTTTPIAEPWPPASRPPDFPSPTSSSAAPSRARPISWSATTASGRRKPILLLAHIDVVEALRADWTTDPFVLLEKDGYFYGRGTMDDKAQAAVWIANLIRYRREGFHPDRDLIVALTADEEGGGPYNGVDWLLKNQRDLIEADFAINEGARGEMVDGKRISNDMSLSEKIYSDFRLEVRNKGGHSARPVPDNAIYHLAGGSTAFPRFAFPYRLNEITRGYFRQMAKIEKGPLAADLARVAEGNEDAMRTRLRRFRAAQRHDAHHLRRHPTRRRPRHQCPAPTRRRQRQLPHPPGGFRRRCARHAEESRRRRSGRDHHQDQRRPQPRLPDAPRYHAGLRADQRHHVARRHHRAFAWP